jgi:hypothetical protein
MDDISDVDEPPAQKYSLVYRHLLIYRFVVNVLFLGRYAQRFDKVIALLDPERDKSVIELCFGDIYIAKWCKDHGVKYIGLDLNAHFVAGAKKRGYDVHRVNLRSEQSLPQGDVIVMMGSLYHFSDMLDELLDRVMGSCQRFVISARQRSVSIRRSQFAQ